MRTYLVHSEQQITFILHLNEDVLWTILSYLSTRDALNLSATTRAIHLIAKRSALSTIAINNGTQLSRVADYLLGDTNSRPHYLRCLVIGDVYSQQVSSPRDNPAYFGRTLQSRIFGLMTRSLSALGIVETNNCVDKRHLQRLLEAAVNLTSLEIFRPNTILENDPGVGRAIAALPRLHTLEMREVEHPEALEFLHNLSSSPRKFTLRLSWNTTRCDTVFASITSMRSLQTLCLVGSPQLPDCQDDHTLSHYSWPAVHELSLTCCSLSMSQAARAFPNVKVLRLELFTCRPRCSREPCWSRLDRVVAWAQAFEEWHIFCPVCHLSITSILGVPAMNTMAGWTLSGKPDLATTLRVVADTQPVALDFKIMLDLRIVGSFYTDLIEVAPMLRSLEIELCAFNHDWEVHDTLRMWMDTIPSVLSSMTSLGHVGIWINCHLDLPFCEFRARPLRYSVDSSVDLAYVLASVLTRHIPSMRSVFVGFGHDSPLDARDFELFYGNFRWWEVKDNEERSLHPITLQMGEGLREGLMS